MSGTTDTKTGTAGAPGTSGQNASLTNAVTGSVPGGTLALSQTATGGAGGADGRGLGAPASTTGGSGGYGTSALTFADSTASTLVGSANGYGGAGGNVDSGAAGAGGAGTATVALTGANAVNATANAKGGAGGGLYIYNARNGSTYEGNGTAGAGGAASASASATTSSKTANVTATATAIGGAGGSHLGVSSQVIAGGAGGAATGAHATATEAAGATGGTAYAHAVESVTGGVASGLGANVAGANGGAVSGTSATASGYNARAVATQTGGAGLGGLGGASGGAGGASTLTNAVSGSTDGGFLKLYQTAVGGAGGYAGGPGGTAGAGGVAASYLTLDDTKNAVAASSLIGISSAYGGFGGTGGSGAGTANGPPGAAAGEALSSIALTGANAVNATANATGGRGGGNDGAGGAAGAAAAATSTTTSGVNVLATANATGGAGGSNSTNNGGAGGGVTGTSATATENATAGGLAKAVANAQGGNGFGAARGNGYTGGAGGAVSRTTATAIGFNAVATVNQAGGGGDGGISGASGGAGAASTLTNAAGGHSNGGYLQLSQTAVGGAGGSTGTTNATAGNGGVAGSYLTFNDTTNKVAASALTGTANAYAGAGGSGVASGGAGGAGTARIAMTGANTVIANSTARGGSGGDGGAQGAGGDASAQSTATATGISAASTATANATANGAAGSAAGTGTADAGAVTAAGQQANASAGASGSSTDTATATATTHGAGTLTLATASATATGLLGANANAGADIAGNYIFFPVNPSGAYAQINGMPDTQEVASLLGTSDPTLSAEFGASAASVVGAGLQGAQVVNGSGNYTIDTTTSWTLNPAGLTGDLIAGMVTTDVAGSGFTSLTFGADVNGVQVASDTFTSLAAAQTFFTDNAVNLGPLPATSAVAVTLNLDVTASGNNGFGAEFLLGTEAAPCFAAGTRIATVDGEVAVEDLAIGQRVVARGLGAAAIVWIGHRRVDCRRHPRPQDVLPVRIAAGAFAPGVPRRDLLLSPDHAVLVGGVLIPIRYLLNGATIVQEPCAHITYWHVELAQHDILQAEGLACESYLDTGNRSAFANGGGAVMLHPDFARGVWTDKAYAPLVMDGPARIAAHGRLLDRAGALGYRLTDEPAVRLRAGGRTVPMVRDGNCAIFLLPQGTRRVHLLSRSAVPAETSAARTDHRRLGVALSHLLCDGMHLPSDDPRFGRGWHRPEDGFRWTDGDAVLDATGMRMLAICVAMAERYWSFPRSRRRQAKGETAMSQAALPAR